jgi:hypothetical protein
MARWGRWQHLPDGYTVKAHAHSPSADVPLRVGRRNLSEHEEQRRLFLFIELLKIHFTDLSDDLEDIWAVPNGGHRFAATAGRLKAEGVKTGVPDVHCAVPRNGYHGLFIEMKSMNGRVSDAQSARILRLNRRGYLAQTICGWHSAAQVLSGYFGLTWRPAWAAEVEWIASKRWKSSSRQRMTRPVKTSAGKRRVSSTQRS